MSKERSAGAGAPSTNIRARVGSRLVARPGRVGAIVGSLALVSGLVFPLLTVLGSPPVAAADAPLALPDLVSVIPTHDLSITHPTASTKEFDYEHIVFNNGT